jgi:hypothetical protein
LKVVEGLNRLAFLPLLYLSTFPHFSLFPCLFTPKVVGQAKVNGKKAHRMESKPDRGVNLIKVHYMVI